MIRCLIVGIACWLLGATSALAQIELKDPKLMKAFQTSPGLEIQLWAGEYQPGEYDNPPKDLKSSPRFFVNPTCMEVDHKGRVWIPESVNYRQKLRGEKVMRRPEGDRILVLEDAKGGGKADTVHVFYQAPEIHSPLGIAVLPYPDGKGQKVYVCQSPHIWVFEDKDGDLKADGPPTVLLTGFKGLDHDHGVHGIIIGPDNKLYFTVGDSGFANLKSSDGKGPVYNSNSTDARAATVWRCDLDGKNLQLIAHNFRNNYEPCVDSFGTVYLSDNDDDGNQQTRICYVMQGGDYGYHRNPKTSHWNEEHPGIVPKILRTYFGSPTGICVYEGDLLPKKYRGQLLHTDAGPRQVRCYHVTPKGAAYSATQEDMVQSTDNWFRPSDVCVAPDGSVFVADWYDPGVGGHGMGDITRGRIYRIVPKGSKPRSPRLDLSSAEGIRTALGSPNLAMRAIAMAKLEALGNDAVDIVLPAAQKKNPDRVLRARALWQLGRFGNLKLVANAFVDADPDFRVLAMRIFHDFHNSTPLDYVEDWQKKLMADPSAAVRREALLHLQKAEPAKVAPMIYDLAKQYDGKDRFYLAAVGIAVGHHDQKRRDAIFASLEKNITKFDEKVAGLLWELRPPQAGKLLEARLTDTSIPAGQRSLIVDILADSADGAMGEKMLKALVNEKSTEVRDRIITKLRDHLGTKWKGLQKNAELGSAIDKLLSESEQQSAALALIAAAEKKELLPKVMGLAGNSKAAKEVRIAALQTLGSFRDADVENVLTVFASKETDDDLVNEAIRGLGAQGTKASFETLRNLTQTGSKLSHKQTALAGLAASKKGAEALLADFSAKKLAGDLTSDLSRLLRNSPFKDVKNQANNVLPAPPKLDPKKLPSIPALLARKGNVNKGGIVMERSLKNDLACLKCHTVNGNGGKVGPDLSVIGSKASRENLLESILYPSKAINHQFQTWIVETNKGLTITGIVMDESANPWILRDAAQKEYKVPLNDIATKTKSPLSIMPDNLLLYVSEEDLVDLVEYLHSLKSPQIAPATSRLEFGTPGDVLAWVQTADERPKVGG